MEADKIKLRYRDRDTHFKKEFSDLKIRVALNWVELFAFFVVLFFASLKMICYLRLCDGILPYLVALATAAAATLIFAYFRNYHLRITRFDKEDIYKKVSDSLIDKTKN